MAQRKTVIDFLTDTEYARFNELLDIATLNQIAYKEAHKKEHKPRAPKTKEQKIAAKQANIAKLQAQLEAMLAAQADDSASE